jgi:hypothetical protein
MAGGGGTIAAAHVWVASVRRPHGRARAATHLELDSHLDNNSGLLFDSNRFVTHAGSRIKYGN